MTTFSTCEVSKPLWDRTYFSALGSLSFCFCGQTINIHYQSQITGHWNSEWSLNTSRETSFQQDPYWSNLIHLVILSGKYCSEFFCKFYNLGSIRNLFLKLHNMADFIITQNESKPSPGKDENSTFNPSVCVSVEREWERESHSDLAFLTWGGFRN